MNFMGKMATLSWTAISRPREFLDRMEAIITSRFEEHFGKPWNYRPTTPEVAIANLRDACKGTVDWEDADQIERYVRRRMGELETKPSFSTKHHGDFSLARFCYAACRLLEPEIVVETGVAYGVTTAFILKALNSNQKGRLISIDLPPLGKDADAFVGFLVPEDLKDRWVLYRGTSKRILPKLPLEIGKVDVFVHDSLHTYWNIKRELEMATPFLGRPAVVICDDIQGNKAFEEWTTSVNPDYSVAFKESNKDAVAGLSLFL